MHRVRSRALPGLVRWHLHGSRLAGRDLNGVVLYPAAVRPFRTSLSNPLKSYPTTPSRYGYPQPPILSNTYPQPHHYPGQVYTQVPQRSPRPFLRGVLFGFVIGAFSLGGLVVLLDLIEDEDENADEDGTEDQEAEKQKSEVALEYLAQAGVVRFADGSGFDWKSPPLSLHSASMMLRLFQRTSCQIGKVFVRTDAINFASNARCEDFLYLGQGMVKQKDRERSGWMFWGVFDGHAGPATANILQYALIPHLVRELQLLSNPELESLVSSKLDQAVLTSLASPEIDKAVKTAFLRLDDAIVFNALNALRDTKSNAEALNRLYPARAGSCALVAMFDPETFHLHVACTGDSRAVLGRCSTAVDGQYNSWTAVPLSEDQTGYNEKEIARITAEHPGEDDIIDQESGRLLGLAVTRAFGDCRWKWPAEALEESRNRLWGQNLRPNYKSPPYLTAEPVVTSTKVQNGDFLILASDGFWDHISSEDAVKCVEMWVKTRDRDELGHQPTFDHSTDGQSLPEECWRVTPADFVAEELNIATHLTKNALGGARRDLFRSAMSIQPPDSRNVRDDITVQVIFFDGPVQKWMSAEDREMIEKARQENPNSDMVTTMVGPGPPPQDERPSA